MHFCLCNRTYPTSMPLNDNIRQYRKDHDISQETISDTLAMTQSNYSRVEKGTVDEKMLIRIAKALNTTPDVLRFYHLPPKPTDEQQTRTLLAQKDEMIALLKDQLHRLHEENSRLHARLADCLQGGGSELYT
ncbi:MAG: XRE family transcriptional regulator [Cytophagales bacterium]|nr:MAG: XRE family transcriptional regulator [Cytophagales bacterium]